MVRGPLGRSAFRYDERPRGGVADPPEDLEYDVVVFCWKLRHTQYIISHLDGYGSDRQIVLYYDSDDDSV
jgi:hypothetical protein